MSLSLKHNYDFNFKGDKSDRLVSFIFGFLMYSMTIALASCFFTNNLTTEWKNALNGHLTVEFQTRVDGTDDVLTPRQHEEISEVIKSLPGIRSVRRLRDSEILKILEPWLAGTAIPDDFPFPVIYDVEADPDSSPDLLILSEQLSKISQGVKIHNHANWYAPLTKISDGLFVFAILLSVLMCITVCATVIFITKKTLSVHKDIVKILQLIGAPNSYIASQFKKYYFSWGCKSSFMSLILSIATIFGINYVTATNMLNWEVLKYVGGAIIVPIITTILIMVTSHRTVLFFLQRDEWLS